MCGGGGVIEVYTLQAIMSRRVILGAYVPESPTAKAVSMVCGWCELCGGDGSQQGTIANLLKIFIKLKKIIFYLECVLVLI